MNEIEIDIQTKFDDYFVDPSETTANVKDVLKPKKFYDYDGNLVEGEIETYDEVTSIIPTKEKQNFETENKYITSNLDVEPIPENYADISEVTAIPEAVKKGFAFVNNEGKLEIGILEADAITTIKQVDFPEELIDSSLINTIYCFQIDTNEVVFSFYMSNYNPPYRLWSYKIKENTWSILFESTTYFYYTDMINIEEGVYLFSYSNHPNYKSLRYNKKNNTVDIVGLTNQNSAFNNYKHIHDSIYILFQTNSTTGYLYNSLTNELKSISNFRNNTLTVLNDIGIMCGSKGVNVFDTTNFTVTQAWTTGTNWNFHHVINDKILIGGHGNDAYGVLIFDYQTKQITQLIESSYYQWSGAHIIRDRAFLGNQNTASEGLWLYDSIKNTVKKVFDESTVQNSVYAPVKITDNLYFVCNGYIHLNIYNYEEDSFKNILDTGSVGTYNRIGVTNNKIIFPSASKMYSYNFLTDELTQIYTSNVSDIYYYHNVENKILFCIRYTSSTSQIPGSAGLYVFDNDLNTCKKIFTKGQMYSKIIKKDENNYILYNDTGSINYKDDEFIINYNILDDSVKIIGCQYKITI